NANARQANAEKQVALHQAYRAHLAAASAALQNHDVADAGRQLEAAPKELRGWEWWHLHTRLDDRSAVIPLLAGSRDAYFLPEPPGLGVGAWTGAGVRLRDREGGEHKPLPIGLERGYPVAVTQTRRGLRVAMWVGNTTFDLLDETGQALCRMNMPE